METDPPRRRASTARNIIALVALLGIVAAIIFVLNRPQPAAVIVSRNLATPLPASALAERYPLTSMLFTAEIRNDGASSEFDVVVNVFGPATNWTQSIRITLDQGETETVVLDFGALDGIRDDLEYEIEVTPR